MSCGTTNGIAPCLVRYSRPARRHVRDHVAGWRHGASGRCTDFPWSPFGSPVRAMPRRRFVWQSAAPGPARRRAGFGLQRLPCRFYRPGTYGKPSKRFRARKAAPRHLPARQAGAVYVQQLSRRSRGYAQIAAQRWRLGVPGLSLGRRMKFHRPSVRQGYPATAGCVPGHRSTVKDLSMLAAPHGDTMHATDRMGGRGWRAPV